MNEIPRQPKMRPTTQAAEGVPRLRWTLEEFERMAELGILTEDDRIELIGGELVPMSPKGNRHEVVRSALLNWLRRNLPDDVDYHAEPGWRAAGNYCEPDFIVGPAGCSPTAVRPGDVMLLIEVAHWSLKFDTTIKAGMYAALGVPEYWVVNAKTLATRVHRGPPAQRVWERQRCPPWQDPEASASAVSHPQACRSRDRVSGRHRLRPIECAGAAPRL